MTNERDNSTETTGTSTHPESSAVQVDDDANTDSGNSPPPAGNSSSHHAKPSNTEVAATKIGTAADLSRETPPTDAPETSDDEDPLRDLPPEDQETARRLIAWARDMDAAKNSGETKRELARLYPRDVVLGKVQYDPTKDGAWQRLMRDKYADKDLRTSGFNEAEVQALRVGDFEFAYVDAKDKIACKEIRAFIEKYESLQRMPNRPTHRFVARAKKNGKLAGAIVMGTGYDDRKQMWLMGKKDELVQVRRHDLWLKRHPGEPVAVSVPARMLEKLIARGACISWSPKGLGSALIKWAIKWMVQNTDFRVFTAYSDPEAGELGTIYRNLGFKYLGPTPPSEACFDPTRPDRGEFSDKDLRRLSRYKRYAKQLGIPWDRRWERGTSVLWANMPPEVKQALKQAWKDAKAQYKVRWQAPKMRWAYVYGVNTRDTARLLDRFEKLNREVLQLTPPTERGVPPEYPPPTHTRRGRGTVAIPVDSQEAGQMPGSNCRRKVVSAEKHARRLRKREKRKLRWQMEWQERRARRREDRKFYDFVRTVRYVAQCQQKQPAEQLFHHAPPKDDADQSVRTASTVAAVIVEHAAGAEGGNGPSRVASGPNRGSLRSPSSPPPGWPPPPTDAFYGLPGEIVRTIEPHSEADPVAILVQVLVAFGSAIGRGPHFVAESERHFTNEFAILVGETAKARKGSSWAQVRSLFDAADRQWATDRVLSGLRSGEGLIWQVRDAVIEQNVIQEKGKPPRIEEVEKDAGVSDKRLLVLEPEFGGTLRVSRRPGNSLSAVIRQAWDAGDLRTLTKNAPAIATGAHISIIGHVTREEVRRHLNETDAANGFANRFLWVCVRRSKILPEGGNLSEQDIAPLITRLNAALAFARAAGELRRDDDARTLWHAEYAKLSEGEAGFVGAVLGRAEAHTMRLACLYALLDASPVIREVHLQAALALWRYCEESARYVFDQSLGDPVAEKILKALRASANGLTRTEIRDMFARHRTGEEIEAALELLARRDLGRPVRETTNGREAERWFVVRTGTAMEATKATKGNGDERRAFVASVASVAGGIS